MVNVSGNPVNSQLSDTAVSGTTTDRFSAISTFLGSSSGHTTFLAGSPTDYTFTAGSTSATFTANGSNNTLDLSPLASPTLNVSGGTGNDTA